MSKGTVATPERRRPAQPLAAGSSGGGPPLLQHQLPARRPSPLILGLALITLACLAETDDTPAARRLAAWDFEQAEGTTVPDASANGHDGTARALEDHGPPAAVEAMVGRGMRFIARHGTDVVVENNPSLNPADGLTVAAWIKHEGPIRWTTEILGKKGQAKAIVDGYRLFLSKAGRLCFEIGDGTAVYRVNTQNQTIEPDVWYHVAATFTPGRLQLYLNTRLIGEISVDAGRIAPSRNHLVIGNFAGRRSAYPFNGIIDEVELFTAALDADAIFQLAKPDRLRR